MNEFVVNRYVKFIGEFVTYSSNKPRSATKNVPNQGVSV